MNILSNLSERLEELISYREITPLQLANEIHVNPVTIRRYVKGIRLPTYENLIALADYFDCSADFLLGLSEYPKRENQIFQSSIPFHSQFRAALAHCGVSQYALQKRTHISWGTINDWLHGRNTPLPDTLVKIALVLECSVDFLLGRER